MVSESDSNPRAREGWLKVHGERQNPAGTSLTGLTVNCPYRGRCALHTCLECKDFCTLALDFRTRDIYVVCPKSGQPELILETRLRSAQGDVRVVHVYAQMRSDESWEGSLEFADPRTGVTMRTGCETTACCRGALIAWAENLSRWGGRGFWTAYEGTVHEALARSDR